VYGYPEAKTAGILTRVVALLAVLTVRPTISPRTAAAAWTTWVGSSGEANKGVASDHTAKFKKVTARHTVKRRSALPAKART
jgi:hypothetical protein